MGVTGNKGIDVRQTANRLIFRVLIQDTASPSAIVVNGTTTLMLLELQDDGTVKTYDFSDNTFKATTCTTPTVTMTHRTANNGGTDTGIWTYVLSTLTGFTKNAIYFIVINNTGATTAATPIQQVREFQFGGEQGDALTLGTDNQVLISANAQDLSTTLSVNAQKLGGATPNNLGAGAQMDLVNAPNGTALTAIRTELEKSGTTLATLLSRIIGTLLTGNHNPQGGDAYARVGANGAGLTALGDTRLANLDAAVSSRPSAEDIDTQLSGVHGPGAWGPGGASGAYTVHIQARDADTLAIISDALVTVKDAADAAQKEQKRTADDGTATRITTSLDAGTYTIHISAIGYQAYVGQKTVDATHTDFVIDVTPIAVGVPTAPNTCRVYGYEYFNGSPVSGKTVRAKLSSPPQATSSVVLESTEVSTLTDSNGYWYLDLVQGKMYFIWITSAGIQGVAITAPALTSVDIRTLLSL